MSSDFSVRVQGLGKHYQIYDKPHQRLAQMLWRGRRRFFRDFQALNDISFELPRGGTLGIIGRNGAGKSTLLQIICGTLAPSAGTVEVNGHIGALLELGTGFNPEFSGRDNLRINAAIHGLSERQLDERLDDILAFADLGDFIDQPVKTYSSGMVVRLAFSVVVHVDPDILVVDEALAVGDALFQAKCMTRMKRLLEQGTSLLFTSHDVAAVKAMCTQTVWLERGRMRASGDTATVSRAYSQDWIDEANRMRLPVGAETARVDPVPQPPPALQEPTLVHAPRTGSGAAQFVSIGWRIAQGVTNRQVCGYGDGLVLRARIRAAAPCRNLVVSYHIKDRANQHLLGSHTRQHPQVYAREWQADDELVVEFSFTAVLHAGDYSVTLLIASIGDVAQYTDAVFLDWVEDAAVLTVQPRAAFPLSDLVELDNDIHVVVAAADR
jgi:lipopolysaccharide transport system ATP-binding protein